METLQIKKENAVKAFTNADAKGKQMLKELFPDAILSGKITDYIDTFEDIERISGKKLTIRSDETDDEFAYRQAKLIAEVYNEGTVLDPMDTSQYKYFPWFKIDKTSGVGLSSYDYDYWYTVTLVGVRLCFKSAELATDAGKKFIHIYSKLNIK